MPSCTATGCACAWCALTSGAVPKANRPEDKPRNKPLGFALTLDLDAGMPYLEGRGVNRDVAAEFGLGLCTSGKTINGRLGIPIHNAAGEVVAYAGRWVGDDELIRLHHPLGHEVLA